MSRTQITVANAPVFVEAFYKADAILDGILSSSLASYDAAFEALGGQAFASIQTSLGYPEFKDAMRKVDMYVDFLCLKLNMNSSEIAVTTAVEGENLLIAISFFRKN